LESSPSPLSLPARKAVATSQLQSYRDLILSQFAASKFPGQSPCVPPLPIDI